ncbi:MAG: tRNA (guanosine(37)-N1)-methyltransferase TrmD [Endomicrobium sp.]|jgi:tRNA (guanine37-N1)-methyltransferase|nr:tRNA (guanosine(37)-N1)-methyltransferase TrmD [Endomicrobium sp.]
MKIDIITLFPTMFNGPLTESLLNKASKKKIITINLIDIRLFAKNNKVDDRPFGGGSGMVIKPEPLYDAIKSTGVIRKNIYYKNNYNKPYVIYMSPQGNVLNNQIICNLLKFKHLVIICGHYEGIDERILNYVDKEISIGDYVLTGGEIPAMVLIDSVVRMLPGVINPESVRNDSFYNKSLDFPHYTRPYMFKSHKVPKVLLSGNHKKIQQWRLNQAYIRTKKRRPDLLK